VSSFAVGKAEAILILVECELERNGHQEHSDLICSTTFK
jgi:hypothetical protein